VSGALTPIWFVTLINTRIDYEMTVEFPKPIKINVYATNIGWLFEDLKTCIATNGAVSSNSPIGDADRWICIRTSEALNSPDISKTVVQVHDMGDYDVGLFQTAGLVCFTHEMQRYLWLRRGFQGRNCVMPIGARRNIEPASMLPAKPTLGYFTGEFSARFQGKRSQMVVDAINIARKQMKFDVLMIGRHLGFMADCGNWLDRAAGPVDYKAIDVLITCTPSPAVPLSVFESCSIGIPVVTTPRWFPEPKWPNICVADDAAGLANQIVLLLRNRKQLFHDRAINSYAPYLFEDWIGFQVEAAASLK
jgi:hypothetical protein